MKIRKLHSNNKLGLESLLMTNALAYHMRVNMMPKSFIILIHALNFQQLTNLPFPQVNQAN